jgi:hypothetical protein
MIQRGQMKNSVEVGGEEVDEQSPLVNHRIPSQRAMHSFFISRMEECSVSLPLRLSSASTSSRKITVGANLAARLKTALINFTPAGYQNQSGSGSGLVCRVFNENYT